MIRRRDRLAVERDVIGRYLRYGVLGQPIPGAAREIGLELGKALRRQRTFATRQPLGSRNESRRHYLLLYARTTSFAAMVGEAQRPRIAGAGRIASRRTY